MRTSTVALLVAAAIASGCGGEPQDVAPPEPAAAGNDTSAAPSPTAETVAPSDEAAGSRALTTEERQGLRMIATRVGAAVDLFDATVLACPDAGWEACVDRAWSVLYWDMDWPPYYLRRFDARTRGCEKLAVAVKGVSSFNLAAMQLDYGDPAEVGTAIGRRDRLVLVDSLRPAPSELRSAADSACR